MLHAARQRQHNSSVLPSATTSTASTSWRCGRSRAGRKSLTWPVGLLADRVLDIVSFEPTQVQPVPRIAQASRVDFLSGLVTVDGAMLALIDLQNLLAVTMTDGEDPSAADRKSATASQRN